MPHCKIEITQNLMAGLNHSALMLGVAEALHATGCFRADDIKVRLFPVAFSTLGIIEQDHAYVAVEIQIFPDKTPTEMNQILDGVQEVLVKCFSPVPGHINLTSRISYLDKATYRKTNLESDL